MIARLHGTLLEKQPPLLLIDVQGVGYEIEAPMSTFYQLPELQQPVTLLTHLSIREDAHVLYGFSSASERQLFRALIKINGVGPKLALSILSAMEEQTFILCVNNSDTARLTKIPGVGKKTAERLVIEMRDRISGMQSPAGNDVTISAPLAVAVTSPADDAISALIALGYKAPEAQKWVSSVKQDGMSSEELIRKALQAAL